MFLSYDASGMHLDRDSGDWKQDALGTVGHGRLRVLANTCTYAFTAFVAPTHEPQAIWPAKSFDRYATSSVLGSLMRQLISQQNEVLAATKGHCRFTCSDAARHHAISRLLRFRPLGGILRCVSNFL